MLSLVDELLVARALLRRENGINLGSHPDLDRVEARAHTGPQRVGFGLVARENGADRVALRVREIELAAQVGDHPLRAATPSHSTATPSIGIPPSGFTTAPPGETPGQEYGGQQSDSGQLRFIQHVASFFLSWFDE
jgi:hypothetical protein